MSSVYYFAWALYLALLTFVFLIIRRPRVLILIGLFLMAFGTGLEDFKDTFRLKFNRGRRGGSVEIN